MVTGKILVTGAPGNVGTEVVRELQLRAVPLRIGAFNMASARKYFGQDVDIQHFDFLKPETFTATFDQVSHLFLVRPPALANVQRDIIPALRAAVAAGVQHIVFLSLQGVEKNRIVPHYKIEQWLMTSGVDYTFLRASFFMQNLSTTQMPAIRDYSKIALPVGMAKTSFIDVRDIAAVAACALVEPGHAHKIYTLTGAEALDYGQVATIMTTMLQRHVRYQPISVLTFLRDQIAEGRQVGYALVVTLLYTMTRLGNAREITRDVEQILGRMPISFEQFAYDYRAVWAAPS